MSVNVLIEAEGLPEVQVVSFAEGTPARAVLERVATLSGRSSETALLFVEDEDSPVDIESSRVDETWSRVVHHVHRTGRIAVLVHYNGAQREHPFSPSTRVQRVLDWAVGPSGFALDPVIAPEMDLALHGQTDPLPRDAHIGRYVEHPHTALELDLIRGVVANGSPA